MFARLTPYLVATSFLFTMLACKNTGREVKAKDIVAYAAKDTAAVFSLLTKSSSFTQINLDSLRYYANQAEVLSKEINFPLGIAKAKAAEANYQRRKGNYPQAIATGLKVVNMYDSLRMTKELVRAKNLLSDFYKEMGGEKGTTEYLHMALQLSREAQQIAEKENNYGGIVTSLNQQGIILRDISQITPRKDLMDSALALYQEGVRIIEKNGDTEKNLGKFYNNMSQVYNEHHKDYHKALEYLDKAVKYNTERSNRLSLSYNYANISDVYANLGELGKANDYAHRMLEVSLELKTPFRQVQAYDALTNVNKQMKRFDSALYYTERGAELNDSINNLERTAQIAEVQTKYETQKKEEQIGQLQKINNVKNQRMWLAFGVAALVVVLAGLFFVQNKRLQRQKQQITEQSNRLQWMMKELHHRVKNNLQIVSSLLSLQTYRLKDEESVTALKESQLRVQAMSLIHQRLYQVDDVTMVNFKLYLDDLVSTLMRSYGYGVDEFDLKINVSKEFMDVDMVMPMGLLVNEIVTNSFKYAYRDVDRPLLHIILQNGGQELQLDIRDNGPGFGQVAETVKQQGFGKKLIDALSRQLKATYSVESSAGTHYHFIIPDKKDKAA